ncbi:hypothetical protein MBLNU457_5906t1 [Dothideomycetes sp. NU457]
MAQPPPTTLPSIVELPNLPAAEQTAVLDLLFEPSPPLHALVKPILQSSHSSYTALINQIRSSLHSLLSSSSPSSLSTLDAILQSHPRLGASKVDSAQSRAEQASLGNAAEGERLRHLNEEYEVTFPGLRFVVFVNGRSREVVMDDMRRRIARGDLGEERKEGIEAMCDIAIDRARKMGNE